MYPPRSGSSQMLHNGKKRLSRNDEKIYTVTTLQGLPNNAITAA